MSSGFVSGGTSDAPIERSDEWLAAQQELERNRQRKAEESRQAASGRSLFETLEANKAAKQEAFEEANRLKNQFRALDEDEVEFLDSVLESTRADEERIRKETAEGLEAFRRRQEEADKKLVAAKDGDAVSPVEEQEEWTAGAGVRKRKRREKEGLRGVKLRKDSTGEGAAANAEKPSRGGSSEKAAPGKGTETPPEEAKGTSSIGQPAAKPDRSASTASQAKAATTAPIKPALGLVDYGSDSDD